MPGPTIQDVLDKLDVVLDRIDTLEYSREEYCNTGDIVGVDAVDDKFMGQTFTPQHTHKISHVKLKLYRTGTPGTINVSIRATNGTVPTGVDLCSGTLNGNLITNTPSGSWYIIPFASGVILSKGIKYSIVINAPAGDMSNLLNWRTRDSSGYPMGIRVFSNDGGINWNTVTTWDMMFEEYENRISTIDEINLKLDAGDIKVYTESQHARNG